MLQKLEILAQITEQRRVSIRATSQHIEDQKQISLCEVSIAFHQGQIQQFLDLRRVYRTTSEILQEVSPLALFPGRGEVDDALETKVPLLHCSVFEDRTDVLV